MSQSLLNKSIYARTMNGVITLSDGTLTIQNGNITNANNINSSNLQTNYLQTQLLDISTNVLIEGNLTLKQNFNCGDASIDTHTVKGKMTFFDTLPESSITPTTGAQLITKTYADNKFVDFTSTQNITGLKSFNTVLPQSSVVPSSANDLITKSYADGRFMDLSITSGQTVSVSKRFSNISVNKPNTSFVFDASGLCNFDNVVASITIVNYNFTTFTGYTVPVYPTITTLLTNTNTTTTLNSWTISMGTQGTTLWSNGSGGLEFYGGPPPGYSYYLWNRSYMGYNYYLQQSITLDAGIYIMSFWSYWGWQNVSGGGASNGLITVSVQNSTDILAYNDADTRASTVWRQRTFRFTVNTSGASYIRWTPSDNQAVGTPFPWAIGGVIVNKYEAIKYTNLTQNVSSYISGNISILNNAYINNMYGSGTLSLTGSPSFFLASPNVNCLSINSGFGSYGAQSNTNSLMIGQATGQYGQTFSRMIGIGTNLNYSSSPPITSGTNCIMLGTNQYTAKNEDILIGHFVKSSGDSIGQNIAIGQQIGVSTPSTLDGVGVGRRTIAIGYGIYSGTYNGYGINATQPLECISIGYYSQRTSFDNYNTSIGAYTLQSLIGNANNTGGGVPTPYFTQMNTAVGWSAGSTQTLMNNCCLFGANANTTVNDISNSSVFGMGSSVGASYATAIGSGVVNNVANSIRLGRSNDLVQIDGSLNILGNLSLSGNITNALTKIDGNLNLSGSQFNLSNLMYPSQSQNSIITGATTITTPYYQFYSVSAGATAFTITLPTITTNMLGKEISFFRIGGTTTTVISFIGNGTQKVFNTVNTGGTTAQALMGSGVYRVKLVPMVDTTVGTFGYFQS